MRPYSCTCSCRLLPVVLTVCAPHPHPQGSPDPEAGQQPPVDTPQPADNHSTQLLTQPAANRQDPLFAHDDYRSTRSGSLEAPAGETVFFNPTVSAVVPDGAGHGICDHIHYQASVQAQATPTAPPQAGHTALALALAQWAQSHFGKPTATEATASAPMVTPVPLPPQHKHQPSSEHAEVTLAVDMMCQWTGW